ncbi:MAG: HAD family acid phosphatase, partial [Nannocystaceae bacterium]
MLGIRCFPLSALSTMNRRLAAAVPMILLAVFAGCGGQQAPPSGPVELNATLFHQLSAEYRAVVQHVFKAAEARLDERISDSAASALEEVMDVANKPPAIIVDVDETMLDNSPWQVRAMRSGTS